MDINYFMKLQNAYGTKNKREKDLVKTNSQMSKHFEDTYDTEDVLLNNSPFKLMIIKDSEGNPFKKKIKSKNSTPFNLGDYIEWNNQIWLITMVDSDDKTWHRGYMYLCTIPLRWQNSRGEIVERYACSEDSANSSDGVSGNSNINIGDNQYNLIIPIDEETKHLMRDMRFPIDFEDSEKPDTYKLTNRIVKVNDMRYFGRGGLLNIALVYTPFNPEKDKRVSMSNGQEVWVCDYVENISEDTVIAGSLKAIISGNGRTKVGFKREYEANLVDDSGNSIAWDDNLYEWIIPAYSGIQSSVLNNKLILTVTDEELIGTDLNIQVSKRDDNLIIGSFTITVCDSF